MTPLALLLLQIDDGIKWFSSLGVGGAVAVLMFLGYRTDRLNTEKNDKQTISVLSATLKENTQAISGLSEELALLRQSLHLNRCPYIALTNEIDADDEARARVRAAAKHS